MDLDEGIHKPYTKPNTNIVYVDKKSNHPPKVLDSIPKGVERRLVGLASNRECFNQEKDQYQRALEQAGFNHILSMEEGRQQQPNPVEQESLGEVRSQGERRNRGRKITWFNPPYNMYIQNNIGRFFIDLVGRHLNDPLLGKLFNKNNLKVSYSCCPKIMARIATHNKKILRGGRESNVVPDNCNCRENNQCPMKGVEPCNVGSVIYRANIKAQGMEDKFYIGGTNNFKARWGLHKQSLRKKEKAKDSALAEQVWLWREQGLQP